VWLPVTREWAVVGGKQSGFRYKSFIYRVIKSTSTFPFLRLFLKIILFFSCAEVWIQDFMLGRHFATWAKPQLPFLRCLHLCNWNSIHTFENPPPSEVLWVPTNSVLYYKHLPYNCTHIENVLRWTDTRQDLQEKRTFWVQCGAIQAQASYVAPWNWLLSPPLKHTSTCSLSLPSEFLLRLRAQGFYWRLLLWVHHLKPTITTSIPHSP
jgi:hypothetical protein